MTNNITLLKVLKRFLIEASLVFTAFAVMAIPAVIHADTLNRQLDLGMTGTDVSSLQTYLAQDSSLYPRGLVTGYFGALTSSAISIFQTRNGLESVGRVGPLTLSLLNLKMGSNMSSNAAPMITSVSVYANRDNVTINWNTNELAKGVIYYSTSPLVTYERTNSVDVSGNTAMTDTNLRSTQNVSIQNLQTNTTYYYLIYTTDQNGNVSVTWPSTFHTSI